ncbi:hypothetical protein [Cognatishimia sp. F0-27]|uniref:hypothetical protein n=1 Tax=Cognatishimia sp. F0-27 TaxID=2816855 RepID=UPI001D0C48D3|nr:hypothetical protein [Cognatishimia sp. F0-27]MCC1493897.1 hypothetical protein [Cognatishimia sp. F0-27]
MACATLTAWGEGQVSAVISAALQCVFGKARVREKLFNGELFKSLRAAQILIG